MEERITGVAILTQDGDLWSLPKPHRHHHVYSLAAFAGADLEPGTQGFTTSLGRFVGRESAASIAATAGQIIRKTGTLYDLYSEDVW